MDGYRSWERSREGGVEVAGDQIEGIDLMDTRTG